MHFLDKVTHSHYILIPEIEHEELIGLLSALRMESNFDDISSHIENTFCHLAEWQTMSTCVDFYRAWKDEDLLRCSIKRIYKADKPVKDTSEDTWTLEWIEKSYAVQDPDEHSYSVVIAVDDKEYGLPLEAIDPALEYILEEQIRFVVA